MKVAFFHIFGEDLIACQNIRNLRPSEAKDIFIGMVQESEIFEYLETGQHHITTPHKQVFRNQRKSETKSLNILTQVSTTSTPLTRKLTKSLKYFEISPYQLILQGDPKQL